MDNMQGKRRVLFVTADLEGGGANRALMHMVQRLDRERFMPSLAVLDNRGAFKAHVPDDVEVFDLGQSRHYRLGGLVRITLKLRALISRLKPHAVFSIVNVANFPAIAAARLSSTRVIAYEVSVPSVEFEQSFAHPWVASTLLKLTYPLAHTICHVSQGIADDLVNNFGIDRARMVQLYTPFDMDEISKLAGHDPQHRWFAETGAPVVVAMGALVPSKGFDFLLRATALLRDKGMAIRVMILGEGPEHSALQELARELGIEAQVEFAGFQQNPWAYLKRARLFVHPSLLEGFGNVIVEAMVCGVPVVAADCPTGPREILEGGRCGMLVPPADHMALAAAMERMLTEPGLPESYVRQAHERAESFATKKVMQVLEGNL